MTETTREFAEKYAELYPDIEVSGLLIDLDAFETAVCADERQRAAERFTEELLYELRYCNIQEPFEGCQQVGFWLTDEAAIAKVRDAIMAEPEEGKS